MKKIIYLISALIISPLSFSQNVKVAGEMKQVMMGKDWSDHIAWDSIAQENLYALAPLSGLKGEVTIIDGKLYSSRLNEKEKVEVEINKTDLSSPFAVYAHILVWVTTIINTPISNQEELFAQLKKLSIEKGLKLSTAFPIRLIGSFDKIDYHIINAKEKEGAIRHGHEAHKKMQSHFSLQKVEGEILAFYSQKHQGIFTHKGSFFHLHFIDNEEQNMGHVDGFTLSNIYLLLPLKSD
ncbi:MAG: acetolactate decarboxylase [Vicingaceae bacterium]